MGIRCWRQGRFRIAIAYLLAFCLLLPAVLLITMDKWHLLGEFTSGDKGLEFFNLFPLAQSDEDFRPTNAQLWWAIALSLPAYLWLRRFTRASVFSLAFAVMGALLGLVTILQRGAINWFPDHPGWFFLWLLPVALLFFLIAAAIERQNHPADSRYFYPVAVLFTFLALSGVAGFHQPYADWLGRNITQTHGLIEYLFIINAVIYLSLQTLSEFLGSPQMRSVAKVFRFVIPGHVLTSILLLGLNASDKYAGKFEARFFEFLLPLAALLFVFGSIPKQMKNFFATGLVFLAIGITRLQQGFFRDNQAWPVSLLITGLLLMYVAVNYTTIKLALTHRLRRNR
jgi:hypothetical protein